MARPLRVFALALISAAAASSSALAADAAGPAACPPPGSPDAQIAVIAKPHWIREPDSRDMVDNYPKFALKQLKSDIVVMDCTVTDAGKLANCRVLSDRRPGAGFDKATLDLARAYQMPPLASLPEFTSLSECVRKAGPPHVVEQIFWRTAGSVNLPPAPPGSPPFPTPGGPPPG